MENASKALLISGAVLIIIILISIVMFILGQGQGVTDQVGAQANTMAIEAHNSIVKQYIGDNISASSVLTLLGNIRNNTQNPNRLEIIDIEGDTQLMTQITDLNDTYEVRIGAVTATGVNTGAIVQVIINKN